MKKLTIILLVLLLPACATRINHPPAPQEKNKIINNFKVDKGKARVHFFIGKYNNTSFQLNEALDIYVNGNKIVTLGNKDEFAVIDLSPGEYTFMCQDISTGSSMSSSIPIKMDLKSGELLFLAGTFFNKTPNFAYLFGAAGALAGKKYIWTFVKDDRFKENIINYKLISLDQ